MKFDKFFARFRNLKSGFSPVLFGLEIKSWSRKWAETEKCPKKVGFCPFLKTKVGRKKYLKNR